MQIRCQKDAITKMLKSLVGLTLNSPYIHSDNPVEDQIPELQNNNRTGTNKFEEIH